MLAGGARQWADRWGRGTRGPGAFVVKTALWPDARCEVDDARYGGTRDGLQSGAKACAGD